MKCIVSDTIVNNRKLFAHLPYKHVYQSYEVLCAAEKAETRAFYFQCIKRPWKLLQRPLYRIYQIWDDEKLILLAPIRIDGKEANMVGHACDMNYTDFLYEDMLLEKFKQAMICLYSKLRSEGVKTLSCLRLADDSLVLHILSEQSYIKRFDSKSVCIDLGGESHDSYFSALGKHAKQNIRTAYNRLKRDNHEIHLLTFSMCGFGESLDSENGKQYLEVCKHLYRERQMSQYGMGGGITKLMGSKWGGRITDNLNYATLSMTSSCSLMNVLLIDGKIAAFMQGYINQRLHSFEVPKLAMNEEFSWYSPGLVLVNETAKYFLQDSYVQYIDLTRGTEKYKTDMGGQFYETHAIKIKL